MRKMWKWTLGIFVFIFILGFAAVLIYKSPAFHDYVLAKIIETAENATGARVEIENYDLSLSTLRANVYRVVVHGTEPAGARPLLTADRIGVGLKIISMMKREVDFRELIIDRPVVHVTVDKEGNNNLPSPKKKSESSTDIFDLAVKHAVLINGELYYNNAKSLLNADVQNLKTELRYVETPAYEGTLSYSDARIQMNNLQPLIHNMYAAFLLSRDALELKQVDVATADSQIRVAGVVKDYSSPELQSEATYHATLNTTDLARIIASPPPAKGVVTADGTLRYQAKEGVPLLEAVFVEGNISSPSLALRSGRNALTVQSVRGRYRLDKGQLTADGIQANLLGGRMNAQLAVRNIATTSEARLRASMQDISLEAASRASADRPLDGVPLMGRMSGDATATWRGSMQNLLVASDVVIQASTTPGSQSGNGAAQVTAIPVSGELHLSYDGERNVLTLRDSYLRTPRTNVQFNGTSSNVSSLAVNAVSEDLHELDVLALTFRRAAAEQPRRDQRPTETPQLLGIRGSATVAGRIQGPIDNPRFTGDLTLNNIEYQQARITAVKANVDVSQSRAALQNAVLRTNGASPVRFDLAVGLEKWAYNENQPFELRMNATEFPLAEIQRLANRQLPVTGALSANVNLSGTQKQPVGSGTLRLVNARVQGQHVQNAVLDFQGTGNSVNTKLDVSTPAGNLSASGVIYPAERGYDIRFNAPGIQIAQLEHVRDRNLEIAGTLSISGSGKGTVDQPQLNMTAQIPQLSVQGRMLNAVRTVVNVANQRADLTMIATGPGGELDGAATVNLTGEYQTTARLDTRVLPLGVLLAAYLPDAAPRDLSGETEIHATLNGPLKAASRIQAHAEIPILTVGYQSLQLGSVRPIQIDYRNGLITLQPAQFKGTNTDLRVQGSAPITGGSFNASATGTIDLAIAKLFAPAVESTGKINLDVTARGDRQRPDIRGEVRIADASFHTPEAPLGVDRLNGTLALRNDRLEITALTAETGGGPVRGTGTIILLPEVRFNVGLTSDNVRLRYPRGTRSILDARMSLTGGLQTATLAGTVTVNRVSFTDDFDLGNFIGQFTGVSVPSTQEGFARRLRLDVAVQATEAAELQSAKVSLDGSANLRVIGTAAEPVIVGRAVLTDGEVFFLGNRYEIQRGTIDFANPVRTQPVVNLAVNTTINSYQINLNFAGPVDRLRTSYTSNPPLPTVDIINLLAFGNTGERPGQNANQPASLGAQSVLAKGLSGQVSGRVAKLAGISHLSIDPLLGGNQKNPGARVAIQQRVTKNLFFTFATDVTSTQNEVVQLEYQMSPTWSVNAVRDENGGYAVTFKRRKSF